MNTKVKLVPVQCGVRHLGEKKGQPFYEQALLYVWSDYSQFQYPWMLVPTEMVDGAVFEELSAGKTVECYMHFTLYPIRDGVEE
jgi:hypothetical protein